MHLHNQNVIMTQDYHHVVAMEGIWLNGVEFRETQITEVLVRDNNLPLILHLRNIGWELINNWSPRQRYVFAWMLFFNAYQQLPDTEEVHLSVFYETMTNYLSNLLRFRFDIDTITEGERRVALAFLITTYILGCVRQSLCITLDANFPQQDAIQYTVVTILANLPGLNVITDIQNDTSIRVQIPSHNIDCEVSFVVQ